MKRMLLFCGVIAPVYFIGLILLGGVIRPGYSHSANTISELFSPGSPNKTLLDPLYTLFALLLVLFGIGILQVVRSRGTDRRTGTVGAALYILMGLLHVTSATIFPQDAWGTPVTFRGVMHFNVHGLISLVSMLSFVLLGFWAQQAGGWRGFFMYSLITVGAAILSAWFFLVNLGSPIMGIAERIAMLAGFQWTFVLALWLVKKDLSLLEGSRRMQQRDDSQPVPF